MLTKLFQKGKEELNGGSESLMVSSASAVAADNSQNYAEPILSMAPIVAVLGAKGGAGASTLAINLGAALANGTAPTTVVDANFQQPDIAPLCGQDPPHSMLDLISRSSIADRQLFEACTVQLPQSRLSLLSPPINGDAAARANLSDLALCLKNVRSYSPFWVVDLPRHLDKHLVTLADMCDQIVLVFEATLSSVAASQRWLNVFRQLGYDPARIICVLNRAGSKYSGVEQQLATCFEEQTVFRVPNASAVMWESETKGIPVVLSQPGHAYSRAVIKLAKHLQTSVSGGAA
jgi:pilus assembly protein CpaE